MIRCLHGLWLDRKGLMAVEFAIIVPLLLTMLIGCFELTYALQAEARLRTMAHGIANIVAKQSDLDAAAMADICTGGRLMMQPFAPAAMSIAVTSVTWNGGAANVDWQDTSCGTAAQLITNPTAAAADLLAENGDSAILVQATYSFQSPTQFFLPATLTLSEQAYARPYGNQTVTHP